MQYGSWNKIQLLKHLKQAEKRRDYTDAGILKQLICDTVIPFDPDVCPNTDEFNKQFLKEYDYYLPHIKDFANTSHLICSQTDYICIPINSQLEFAYEFFSSVAPKWMDIFDDIYKERKKNLKIGNSGNYSVYLSSIDYSYLSINKNMAIDDLFNLVHEYTHTIVDRICYRLCYNSHYPFIELPSICSELIAAVFMKDYYMDIDEEVDNYLMEVLNVVIDYARNIIATKRYLDGEITTTPDNISLIHDMSYVLPFIHAFELFYLFLSDKEKWFYTINKIINMPPTDNYEREMKKLGLTPNSCLNKFISDLDNHLIV